jgi:hypothetical protein
LYEHVIVEVTFVLTEGQFFVFVAEHSAMPQRMTNMLQGVEGLAVL